MEKGSAPSRRISPGKAFPTAALFAVLLIVSCGPRGKPRPNVVLITVESVRADHVGCYGFSQPTTPHLDDLAREGTVFENAHAVTSWTLSSHATLFTGLYPSAHQVQRPRDRLGDSYTTLAEVLREDGYQTAGFVSGPFLRKPHNLDQGFEIYDDSPSSETQETAHGDITNPAIEQLLSRFLTDGRDKARPFFLFAYLWDPHYDYLPPAPYDTLFTPGDAEPFDVTRFEQNGLIRPGMTPGALDYLVSQYDGEIRCTDDLLGRLFDLLRGEGLWENTLVIVTADHGEEFFDHGEKGHKNNLYTESVHVPLVIKWPGDIPPRRDGRLAGLIDLYPTVAEAAGIPLSSDIQGKSLLGPPRGPDDPLFFELITTFYGISSPGGPSFRSEKFWAVLEGRYKMISTPAKRANLLFDVKDDPGEKNDIGADREEVLEKMLGLLTPWQSKMQRGAKKHGPPENAFLSESQLDRLKALGYLGD